MKILIACEESQAVTKEFRVLGHEAYSCDIEPCGGDNPEWHLQQDLIPLLEQEWDMILAFPPCTYLTVTGNRWFNIEKYGEKAIKRHRDREEAVEFFMKIANAKCEKIVIENPVGVMSTNWRKPNQIIQPYEHGHEATKTTCLWIKGLPNLVPTDIVGKGERTVFKSGKSHPKWYADALALSPHERAKVRSRTFQGIAKAMATQWG